MARVDKAYFTLYLALKLIIRFPDWLNKQWRSVWVNTGIIFDDVGAYSFSARNQLIGACQPLVDMLKDAENTLRPYGCGKSVLKDFAQPIYGVANLLKGILYLIAILPSFIFNLFYAIPHSESPRDWVKHALIGNGIAALAWFIDGIFSILRGISQILATPLTWFIKIPLRGIITASSKKEDLYIENKASIQKHVTWAKKIKDDLLELKKDDSDDNLLYGWRKSRAIYIINEIHRKYASAVKKGWETGFNQGAEQNLWQSVSTEDGISRYLNLFHPEPKNPVAGDADLRGNELEKEADNSLTK